MSGVFVSYSREDRAIADGVRRALVSLGVEVVWDQSMPGVDSLRYIGEQIGKLGAVVVVWTKTSAKSDSVDDEARLARRSSKLVNLLHGLDEPPFPYERINGLPIHDWDAGKPHAGWRRVIETIEPHLIKVGSHKKGELVQQLFKQQKETQQKQTNIDAGFVDLQEKKANWTCTGFVPVT